MMPKPFDSIFAGLDEIQEGPMPGPENYLDAIQTARERIVKMWELRGGFIQGEAQEIEYFRNIWPAFYGKLFLFIRLHSLSLKKSITLLEHWPAVLGRELDSATAFLRRQQSFWRCYQAGASVINSQFTREYDRQDILTPMALIIDQEGATLASWRAARCLAMQEYAEWLRDQLQVVQSENLSAADLGYSWGATDADLAEWLFGMRAVGAIQYNGQPVDVSRLQKWAALALGRHVANIYDRARVLRNRKKE